MADYDTMLKDSKDAARYEELKGQIKGVEKSIRNAGIACVVSVGCAAGTGMYGTLELAHPNGNNSDGYGLLVLSAISAIMSFTFGYICKQLAQETDTLTEELKGLEAVVQKE